MGVHEVGQTGRGHGIRNAHAGISPPHVDSAPRHAHEKSSARNFREVEMESLLYILLLVGIWVVLVKVVFPKIGIQG